MVAVIGRESPTARKHHHCDSCGGSIDPGVKYNRARCVDGGDAWVWKSHMACQKAGDILWDAGIIGDEDCIINVSDMDREDRELVYSKDPETYHAVWPDAPAPGSPKLVST